MSQIVFMLPVAACFLVSLSIQCDKNRTMPPNFCEYIKTDNWKGLKKEVNAFLVTIKAEDGPETNFKKIKDWISAHDCVTSVTVPPVDISTYPPIKEITVALKDNGSSFSKTIGIRFSRAKYEINIR